MSETRTQLRPPFAAGQAALVAAYSTLPTAMVACAVVEYGCLVTDHTAIGLRFGQLLCLAVYAVILARTRKYDSYVWSPLGSRWIEWALVGTAMIAFAIAPLSHGSWADGPWWIAWHVALVALMGCQWLALGLRIARRWLQPGRLLGIGLVVMILIGAGLLMLPGATPAGDPIHWLDALATSTGAICTTALVVRDTATRFTEFGQIVLIGLMQVGGLIMLIFGSILALMAGQAFAGRQTSITRELLGGSAEDAVRHLPNVVRFAVGAGLLFELLGVGGILLTMSGEPIGRSPLLIALFDAVSALMNAGLHLGSTRDIAGQAITGQLVIAPLVIIGSLGLPVLYALYRVVRDRVGRRDRGVAGRLNLHSRLVLATTLGVYIVGAVVLSVILIVDRPGGTIVEQVADAGWLAATRTTGFASATAHEMTAAEQFVMWPLMLIGGSPGSPTGGLRTLTLALLILSAAATLRRRSEPEAFGRTLPAETMRLASVMLVIALALPLTAGLLLSWSEAAPLGKLLFEAISASANSGLGLGVTAGLTSFGKLVIIVTVVIGRVAPLWLLSTVALHNRQRVNYAYPGEPVILN